MKAKKFIAILSVFAMTVGMMAGCGSNTSSKANTAATNAATAKTSAKNEASTTDSAGLTIGNDPMTIEYWDISTEDPGKTRMENAIKRFEADYPQVTVKITHAQNDSYKEKLVVAMSSGQCPDMYIHWGGGPMKEYIDSGYAQDITDLMKNDCSVPFLDAAIAQSTYNGKIYAVPFGGLSGSGFFYNKDIFKKVGIEVPTTITELEADCDKLKAAGYTPFSLANSSKWTGSMYFMYLVARKSGLDEFNAAADGSGSFTSEAFMYAAQKIQDWVKAGYFPDGVNSLSADDGQDRQLLYTEQAAMMLHGTWMTSTIPADDKDFYNNKIGFFTFPKDSDSKADQSIMIGTSIGNGFSFNCTGDKLKACFILATKYINDDTYVKDMVSSGSIPSIKGVGDTITDPVTKQVWDAFSNAGDVQLWYDQYLPPTVAEKHKDTCQEIFGLTMTPQEANQALEDSMQEYLKSKK